MVFTRPLISNSFSPFINLLVTVPSASITIGITVTFKDMKVTVIAVVTGALGIVTKRLVQGTGGTGNRRTSGDHPNYSIVEIGQNTKKSPGDMTRLTVTQTPGKEHQLTLISETSKK